MVRGRSQEDLTLEGRRLRGATPRLRSGAAAQSARLRHCRSPQEELPPPEARGGGKEELLHLQGAVAVRVPDDLEELFHVQGREGRQ